MMRARWSTLFRQWETKVIVTAHCSYTGSLRSLLEHVDPTVGAEVIVEAHCSNSWSRGHCWSTLFQQFEPRSSLEHIVPTLGDGVIVTTHCSYTGSLRSLLEHVVPTVGAEVIVGAHCSNSWSRGHCWSTLFQQFEPRSLLEHIVPTV
jgi:hypothetical protein